MLVKLLLNMELLLCHIKVLYHLVWAYFNIYETFKSQFNDIQCNFFLHKTVDSLLTLSVELIDVRKQSVTFSRYRIKLCSFAPYS